MKEHFSAIQEYALAYDAMERLQRTDSAVFPSGDQKTGVIGEFYARLYAKQQWLEPQAEHVYGSPSEKAWDITIRRRDVPDHKIQVKTVSSHSQTSTVSKIHAGWDELYLLRLNKDFMPIGFWTLLSVDAPSSNATRAGALRCCTHDSILSK